MPHAAWPDAIGLEVDDSQAVRLYDGAVDHALQQDLLSRPGGRIIPLRLIQERELKLPQQMRRLQHPLPQRMVKKSQDRLGPHGICLLLSQKLLPHQSPQLPTDALRSAAAGKVCVLHKQMRRHALFRRRQVLMTETRAVKARNHPCRGQLCRRFCRLRVLIAPLELGRRQF